MMGPLTDHQGGQASTQTRVLFLRAIRKSKKLRPQGRAGQGGGAGLQREGSKWQTRKTIYIDIPQEIRKILVIPGLY